MFLNLSPNTNCCKQFKGTNHRDPKALYSSLTLFPLTWFCWWHSRFHHPELCIEEWQTHTNKQLYIMYEVSSVAEGPAWTSQVQNHCHDLYTPPSLLRASLHIPLIPVENPLKSWLAGAGDHREVQWWLWDGSEALWANCRGVKRCGRSGGVTRKETRQRQWQTEAVQTSWDTYS